MAARDFGFHTVLAEDENPARLSDAVGLEITLDETESSAGDYNVDIYATETGTGRKIIIENQLEDTNHGPSGQIECPSAKKDSLILESLFLR